MNRFSFLFNKFKTLKSKFSGKVAPDIDPDEAEQQELFEQSLNGKIVNSKAFKKCKAFNEAAKKNTLYLAEEARVEMSLGFEHFMFAVTLFVLFGDDIRILAFEKSADQAFALMMAVSFIIYVVEFVILCWSKPGYLLSFFFYLDGIATISLLPEMTLLIGNGLQMLSKISTIGATGKLGRVSRMVRLVRLVKLYKVGNDISQQSHQHSNDDYDMTGLKEDLRLLKTGHLSTNEFIDKQKERQDKAPVNEPKSKLGERLINSTIRNVIIMVLMMLLMFSLLSYLPFMNFGHDDSLRLIQKFNKDHDFWNLISSINEARLFFETSTPYITATAPQPKLVYLEIYPSYPNFTYFGCFESKPTWKRGNKKKFSSLASVCVHKTNWIGGGSPGSSEEVQIINDVSKSQQAYLRPSEILGEEGKRGSGAGVKYSSTCCIETQSNSNLTCTKFGPCYMRYKFNMKIEMMDTATLSIFTNVFIIFMLVMGWGLFISDTQTKVIEPIQKITNMVTKIANDPRTSFDAVEEDIRREGGFEFILIRNAIKTIIELLKISFGEAGFEMIRENLSLEATDQESSIELSHPGTPILAVFAFVVIEDFDFLTQELGGEIMDFVNTIAAVVHENVEQWGGHCNKNLGGSFLMTWKVPAVDYEHERETPMSLELSRIPHISELADSALIGIAKVIAEMRRKKEIIEYEKRKELQTLDMKTGELKPFKVRLRIGLHTGWAIEGPVGSMEKIDATYLSPHVNIAARCATAAKQWHVDILCSDAFVSCLSKEAQHTMRHIDRVCVKGSNASIDMYTFDTLQDQLMAPASRVKEKTKDVWLKFSQQDCLSSELYVLNRHIAFFPADHMDEDKKEAFDYRKYAQLKHDNDDGEFSESIAGEVPQFDIRFHHKKGVQKYLEGNWEAAIDILTVVDRVVGEKILDICKGRHKNKNHVNYGLIGDGPSQTLIQFMLKTDSKPPKNWCPTIGRKLLSK